MDANLDTDAKGAEAHGSSKVLATLSDFFWCHIPLYISFSDVSNIFHIRFFVETIFLLASIPAKAIEIETQKYFLSCFCKILSYSPVTCVEKGLLLKPGPGPWKTWTLKNLDSEKPGPRKIWTLKNLDPENRRKQLDIGKWLEDHII